jgi:phenylalanyl-tRNA synthetase beta chain
MRDTLLAQGLSEITTYSFVSPKYYDKILMPSSSPKRRSVTIMNPLGEDTSIMRTTLLPSMLEVLARNYSNRNLEARFFEVGTAYFPRGANELPDEKQQIAIGMYGENINFYSLKGIVEELLADAGIEDYDVAACRDEPAYHPGRCARITAGCETLAVLGELHPNVQGNYGIDIRVYAAEIDFDLLRRCARLEKEYRPLPKFPATTRDIAVICDEETPVLELEKTIKSAAGKVLESIALFDVYRGKQIAANKKSVAFSISLRVQDRTLTDEEADIIMKKIVAALSSIGAVLRA